MTKYSETLIDEASGYEDELYGWSNSKTIYYPLSFKANDNIYSAHIELKKPNSITIIFEGEKMEVHLNEDHVELNNKKIKLDFIEYKENKLFASYQGKSFKAEIIKENLKIEDIDKGGKIRAPMHGVIRELFVTVGEKVKKNQVILILEAMKMQHEIKANIDGLTSEIRVKENSQVSTGDLLVKISP